jgi:hypothetical protein
MKRIGQIAGLLLCTAALFSCTVSPEDIRLDRVDGVKMDGVTRSQARLTVQLTAANDSRARVVVRQGNFAVSDSRGQIATVSLDGEIALPRRSSAAIDIPLLVRFNGPLGTATALPRLGADPATLKVDGTLRVRGGAITRKVDVQQMPLSDFLRMVGVTDLSAIFK